MFVALKHLAKSFGTVSVLDDLSLALEEGEFLALLGPSGSGKTTALRLLAGFESADRGTIFVAGEDVTAKPPARRGIGMVFQHYALFPHMTVFENVAFGLESQGLGAEPIRHRVREVLELVDMAAFAERLVSAISGGQQQRVALARALAPKPRVLLLDEPLSNLDPTLRERTRRELRAAVRSIGITTVLVTHEQDEAFYLGDRVAILNRGRLEQIGRPETLYHQPQSRFVATFVGHANILRGLFADGDHGEAGVRLLGQEEPAIVWRGTTDETHRPGDPVELIIRPEALSLERDEAASSLRGEVVERRFTGPLTYYTVVLETGEELEVLSARQDVAPGEETFVTLRAEGPRPRIFKRETVKRETA